MLHHTHTQVSNGLSKERSTEMIKDNFLTFPLLLKVSSFLLFSGSDEEMHSILSSVVASRSVSSVSANLFFAKRDQKDIQVHFLLLSMRLQHLEAVTAAGRAGRRTHKINGSDD